MAVNKVTVNNKIVVDMSDDTATSADIKLGKTAHIRTGAKVHGTFEGVEKTVAPSVEAQTVEPDPGYYFSKVNVQPVTAAIDSNLLPENVKQGVTILGVTGTYKGE